MVVGGDMVRLALESKGAVFDSVGISSHDGSKIGVVCYMTVSSPRPHRHSQIR